ncbi:MAG: HU family DNA-binding protein [Treponemataceae bacterium]
MGSNKVTKFDIVDSIYEGTNYEKKTIQNIVDLFLDELKTSLKKSSTIELRGFGTFETRLRKGKESARNPRNGEKVSVPPHYVAVFRAGQDLKSSVWNLPVDEA